MTKPLSNADRKASGEFDPHHAFPHCPPDAEPRARVTWALITKGDPRAARMADLHYSRRKVGSPQFMPPGQTLVLWHEDAQGAALFGWWRPHPRSGIKAMNGLDGWTCTIFRNMSAALSSDLILAAETELVAQHACGPDGLLTYVFDAKVRSTNPGFCFQRAGWVKSSRSADGRKTLLRKPFAAAGWAP